jgi:hypothetical protein
MNIQELRQENSAKGWAQVPSSCPARFLNRICEMRSRSNATGEPIANREQRGYGAWPTADRPARRSAAVILSEAAEFAAKNLAAANRAVEEERAQIAHNAAEVKALLFPWEN